MTRFFTIISAKGGVGKTTATINLASALSLIGRNVIAIDADLTAPNMSIDLGISHLSRTLHDALEGTVPLRTCLYYHASGLCVIPGNIAYESSKGINLGNFKTTLHELEGNTEIVLVDGAPGVGSEAKTIIDAVDFVLPITTPDLAAISDARKTIKMARELNKIIFGVIVNRVRGEEHEIDVTNIQTFLEAPVIGIIPEEESIRAAHQLKAPVLYTHPESIVSTSYKKLAAKIIGEEYHSHAEQKKTPSLGHEILAGWNIVRK